MSIPYPHNLEKPPKAINVRRVSRSIEDTARYIIDPDDDFARPYLAIPGGRAFVWPLGTQGFEIAEQAELGRHKYLGEIELDVDVTHKAETTITLAGIFPGWTSVENMNALRQIFYADTPARGKILHLPGIMPNLQYVTGESLRHSHDRQDTTMNIEYSLTLVKVGTGKKAPNVGPTQPDEGRTGGARGRGTRIFKTNSTYNTLRKVARKVFGTEKMWVDLYSIKGNAVWFDKRNISAHKVPDYRLPLGTVIHY